MKKMILVVVMIVSGLLWAASGSYPNLRDGYGWTTSTCTNDSYAAGATHASVTNVAFSRDAHGVYAYLSTRITGATDLAPSNNWVRKTLYYTLQSADPIFFSKVFRLYISGFQAGESYTILTQVENSFPNSNGRVSIGSTFPDGDRSEITKLFTLAEQDAGLATLDVLVEGFTTSSVVNVTFGPALSAISVLTKIYIYHEAGY